MEVGACGARDDDSRDTMVGRDNKKGEKGMSTHVYVYSYAIHIAGPFRYYKNIVFLKMYMRDIIMYLRRRRNK